MTIEQRALDGAAATHRRTYEFRRNGWYLRLRQTINGGGWYVLGKRQPFVTNRKTGREVTQEPGDLWFEFGETPRRAVANFFEDVGSNDKTRDET